MLTLQELNSVLPQSEQPTAITQPAAYLPSDFQYQPPIDRPQSAPLLGTESAANAISRVHYTHDEMINLLISCPSISQNDLAKHFGYSVPWISRVINSDAFQARLAQRKHDLVDPTLLLSIEERLRHVANRSMEILMDKLEAAPNFDNAARAVEISTKALGYGARQSNVAVQASFVVAMPQQAVSATAWAAKYEGGGQSAGVVHETETPEIQPEKAG